MAAMFAEVKKTLDDLEHRRHYLDADWDRAKNKALLEFYVKIMPKVLDAERCSIFIHDPASKEIWLKAGTGLGEKEIRVGMGNASIVGEVVATGEHRIISGLQDKNGAHKKADQKTGFVTQDILAIPIKSLDGNEITGAVEVLNKKGGVGFNDEDKALLEEMAHYLELTMENIFYNQQSAGALRGIFDLLVKTTVVLSSVVILLVLAFSSYWLLGYFLA
ncbi:MAG: GAF domain-containing protein [Gammaproteobacteria bacterium]|nr:GAF domain-containing protein [Gammaproteobacteria bacterium]